LSTLVACVPEVLCLAGSQGDREKQLGMSVSPLMDRQNKGGITRSQVRQASHRSFLSAPLHHNCPLQLQLPLLSCHAPACMPSQLKASGLIPGCKIWNCRLVIQQILMAFCADCHAPWSSFRWHPDYQGTRGKASSSIEPSTVLQQKLALQQMAENPWSEQRQSRTPSWTCEVSCIP